MDFNILKFEENEYNLEGGQSEEIQTIKPIYLEKNQNSWKSYNESSPINNQ